MKQPHFSTFSGVHQHTNYTLNFQLHSSQWSQERKLEKSGLTDYFHHIEVLSDKKEENYSNLLNHLDINPSEFLMIGNSLKSDILPLVNINAHAIHVPFHTTWIHEQATDEETNGKHYKTVSCINEILDFLT